MPSISVVVPTHNRADLIRQTLESVQAQTFADWECLIIDDGSTDDTRVVVAPLVEGDRRLRYVFQENAGRPAAWSRGLSLASGAFVAFLDSDDVWLPRFLETLHGRLIEAPDAVMAAARRSVWDGQNVIAEQELEPLKLSHPLQAMIRSGYLYPSQCLVTRGALDKIEGFRYWPSDDHDLWLQILPHGRAIIVTEPLVKYRQHGGSVSHQVELSKGRAYAQAQIQVLKAFARRRDISWRDRLVALGNIQRRHEHLLRCDIAEGTAPRSRVARLFKLLQILPSPLLRSPQLALHYLRHRAF